MACAEGWPHIQGRCRAGQWEPFSSDVSSLQDHQLLSSVTALPPALEVPVGSLSALHSAFTLLAFALLTCCGGLRGRGTGGGHCGRDCGSTCSWKTGLSSLTELESHCIFLVFLTMTMKLCAHTYKYPTHFRHFRDYKGIIHLVDFRYMYLQD